MPIDVTDQYESYEDASVSRPYSYVAVFRTTQDTLIADDGGTHEGTEITGGTLKLQSGVNSGTWTSPVYDSGLLTPFVIYDLLEWTETLREGTVLVYIRSGRNQNAIEGVDWKSVTSGTLRHTIGFRYYQIKIELSNRL